MQVQEVLGPPPHEAEGIYGDATNSMLAGRNSTGRSVNSYGTGHRADGYGVVGNPGGGI